MKLILVFLLLLPSLHAKEIRMQKSWRGIIVLPQFPLGKRPAQKPSPLLVVNDAKAYAKFLDRIPKKQISRTRPAPPNTDPLLKRPPIDFGKHTLLVITRSSMTRPVFKKVEETKSRLKITIIYPREQISARPIHIGTYTAVLVPKVNKPPQLHIDSGVRPNQKRSQP